jgi:carboxypeptidase Taq
MHIILRYEVERALMDGSLAVADVPRVWNEKMQAYLGATPPDDAQGCLQVVVVGWCWHGAGRVLTR